MFLLLAGLALLVLLLGAAEGFSRADVKTIRHLLAWISALGGLSLAVILLLSGRGAVAGTALFFFAPLVVSWWQQGRGKAPGPQPRPQQSGPQQPRPRADGAMSRREALEVLGLAEGATEEEIHAAYRRLMQAVHPDHGGSEWLATRLNQARATLLGR